MRNTREIINQVINLFERFPDYRDDRYGTIEYIVQNHYADMYGKSGLRYDFKLLTDIDRVFRLVQQEIPALRGKEWLKSGQRVALFGEFAALGATPDGRLLLCRGPAGGDERNRAPAAHPHRHRQWAHRGR